ncbi:uncharacterized protein LOC123487483 [Coregonus clupeaformis]|uniref:uncharacterized protein LOC123487483 n=1 Tax=Coregonus clupeaformis TaxID=59861 RepID=UPI001E1C2713|nr:uncharacterized protein LOC123487483 [Coregonus clupeaformis]
MAVKLSRLVRRTGRGATPLTVPELSLVLKSNQPPERVLSRALSSVASLLRLWRVQCLDLTDFWIQGHSLITLLCHQGPLSLRLNSDTLQQLTVVVYEAQDKDLTQWFLEKVGGDLTSCRLDLEVLLSLLQHSTHNITVDLRKNRLLEKNISDLLPFLGRVIFKRSSSSFVKSTIRQIYDSRASDCVSSLLRSSDHWINLNSRELDRVDCTALGFTLKHCHQVKVNLLWTSIPPGEIESILPLLDRVSQLSVDRRLLLSFLQCCAASQIQQGAPPPPTAVWLLRSLHHRLDFSCSSSVDLSAQDQEEALCLTTDHCRAIHSVLKQNQHSTQLVQNQVQIILRDCEVEDRALRELLPHPAYCQAELLDLVCEWIEEGVLRHAESLCRALDGELDLSETRLDQKACGSLALVLEHSEGLSELDLSHCQLTDHHLQALITHLHKIQQGAPPPPTAVWLLRSLHYRLDFSCSSSVDLSAQDQEEALCLTTDHCRAIHSVLKQNQHSTQLVQNQVQIILRDCEVEDRALRELLPILHIVKLSPSKALLRQLLDLVCEWIEEGVLRHAESLCRALDGELDLSETRLDQKACGSLALVLEHSEGLSELDLSHCQLTDHHLQALITHLHKVQVLELFNNRIQDRRPFLTDKRFEIW